MKIGAIIIGALIAIALTVVMLWLFNPLCPGAWSKVIPGMTEQEVATVVRSTFDTPIGLEQTYMRETKKEFWYSRGTYHRFSGREWTLIVTYDATGLEAGLRRKVVGTAISCHRLPFTSFLKDFTQWN